MQELSAERWTGLLRLERAGERIAITVEHGSLVFASSSNPDHRLGPLLLRRGVITLRQMEDAGRALSPGKRFGTVLVEMGFLELKELVRGVVDQTRDIILHALQWTWGTYQLEGAAPAEAITLDISTPSSSSRGSRGSRRGAASSGARGASRRATRRSRGARGSSGSSRSTWTRRLSCARSRPSRDVESLCAESMLNDFEACRNLWAFRVIGLIRRVEEATPFDDDGLEYVLPADGE